MSLEKKIWWNYSGILLFKAAKSTKKTLTHISSLGNFKKKKGKRVDKEEYQKTRYKYDINDQNLPL